MKPNEELTREQLEWTPVWKTDPGCSKPGCGYPDGKPCIGCGRTVSLADLIAEHAKFRGQRNSLDIQLRDSLNAIAQLQKQVEELKKEKKELYSVANQIPCTCYTIKHWEREYWGFSTTIPYADVKIACRRCELLKLFNGQAIDAAIAKEGK